MSINTLHKGDDVDDDGDDDDDDDDDNNNNNNNIDLEYLLGYFRTFYGTHFQWNDDYCASNRPSSEGNMKLRTFYMKQAICGFLVVNWNKEFRN